MYCENCGHSQSDHYDLDGFCQYGTTDYAGNYTRQCKCKKFKVKED